MKLNKSTTILVNVLLILIIAVLIKSLVITPRSLQASSVPEYLAIPFQNLALSDWAQTGSLTNFLNIKAKEGWRLHSVFYNGIIFNKTR